VQLVSDDHMCPIGRVGQAAAETATHKRDIEQSQRLSLPDVSDPILFKATKVTRRAKRSCASVAGYSAPTPAVSRGAGHRALRKGRGVGRMAQRQNGRTRITPRADVTETAPPTSNPTDRFTRRHGHPDRAAVRSNGVLGNLWVVRSNQRPPTEGNDHVPTLSSRVVGLALSSLTVAPRGATPFLLLLTTSVKTGTAPMGP